MKGISELSHDDYYLSPDCSFTAERNYILSHHLNNRFYNPYEPHDKGIAEDELAIFSAVRWCSTRISNITDIIVQEYVDENGMSFLELEYDYMRGFTRNLRYMSNKKSYLKDHIKKTKNISSNR